MIKILKDHLSIKTVSLALAFALCVIGLFSMIIEANRPVAATTNATIQAMEQELKQIEKKKNEMSAKLAAAKKDAASAASYKTYLDQQANIIEEQITKINQLIAEYELAIEAKNNEIELASANIDNEYNNVMQILRLTHEEGNTSYFELVLGSESFYDFLSRVDKVDSLLDYTSKQMESYKESKAKLEEALTGLNEYKAMLDSTQESNISAQNELNLLQSENEKYIDSLQSDISKYQSTYNTYKAEEDKLDAEIEKLLRELQAKENSQFVGGAFIWPLPSNNSRISSGFGWRTIYGVKENHQGIDIPAAKGTPIYASAAGTVVTATYHSSYGNYVLINHGGGKATLYAHASKLNCKAGDVVKQGQVVAYVGTTGRSTGNHVHFEVRENGTRVNPLNYVKQP